MIRQGLLRAASSQISVKEAKVKACELRLAAVSPERRISVLTAGSSLGRERLNHAIRIRAEDAERQIRTAERELTAAAVRKTENAGAQLLRLRERLEAISPLRVLERGYSMVTDRGGKVISAVQRAREAEQFLIRFADGTVEAELMKDRVGSIE